MNGLPYLDRITRPTASRTAGRAFESRRSRPPRGAYSARGTGEDQTNEVNVFVIVMPVAVSHTDQPGGMRHCMPIRLCAKRPANPVAPSGAGVTIAHLGEVIWVRRDGAPWTAGLTRLFPPGSADGGGPPNPRFVATTPPGPDRPGRRLDGAGPGARIGERRP